MVKGNRQPLLVESYGVVGVVIGGKELRLPRLYHADGVGERLQSVLGAVRWNKDDLKRLGLLK